MRMILVAVALVACGPEPVPTVKTPASTGNTASELTPGGGAQSSTPDCGVPVHANPPGCPERWWDARTLCDQPDRACDTELQCWYPGAGDGEPDGGFSTAYLSCSTNAADPSPFTWLCSQ